MGLLAIAHTVALFFGGRYRAHVSVAKDRRCVSEGRTSSRQRQLHPGQCAQEVTSDTKCISGDLVDRFHFCLFHRVLFLLKLVVAIGSPAAFRSRSFPAAGLGEH